MDAKATCGATTLPRTMQTVLVWLLVNIGSSIPNGQQTAVLATFADHAECEQVALVIREARDVYKPLVRCIEARIAKP